MGKYASHEDLGANAPVNWRDNTRIWEERNGRTGCGNGQE